METIVKSSKGKFLAYGSPRLSASIVLDIIDFGIFTLYFFAYGMHPILQGIAMAVGKLSIAFAQFLMGWISDSTKTKYGKRKPFIFLFAPLTAFAFICAVLPTLFLQNPSILVLFIWILIWDAAFQFSYGGLTTPYQSWVAEQFIVKERPKASAFQNLFSYLGAAVAIVFTFLIFPPVIDTFVETRSIGMFFIIIVIVFALLTIILFYMCAFVLPVEKIEGVQIHFIKDLKKVLKDKNFMRVCWLQAIAFLAIGMITPMLLGFATKVLNYGTMEMAIAAACLFIFIIAFLFVWKKLIDKTGKKKTFSKILITGVIVLPFSLIGLLQNIPFYIGLIFVIGVAAFLGGWYLFPYIWFADLAEDAEKRSGETRKAGLYAGFPQILLNIFQAIALVVTGLIVALPNIPNQEYSWGFVLWGVWCSVMILLAFLFTKKYVTLDFAWEKERTK